MPYIITKPAETKENKLFIPYAWLDVRIELQRTDCGRNILHLDKSLHAR